MSHSEPAIAITGLVRRYGKHDAVNGLDLTVSPGRCYGLFGRNGAGKTTTIKCLLNLLRPDAGSVRVFGLDTERDEVAVKSRLAYVPDQVAFYPWMTVRETLDYLASFRAHWNRKAEAELLGQFRLDTSKKTGALSKGQRTQLALVAAISAEPELLVLDEPTSGLDPKARALLKQQLLALRAAGKTIVVTSHLLADVEQLCDRMAVLHGGTLRYVGSPADFLAALGGTDMEQAFLRCIDQPAPKEAA